MNVRGRCAAGDSIYANNANSQKKGVLGLNEVLIPKVTLLAHKDKSTEQEDRNPVDFLRNTYDKCHTDN